MKYFIYIFCLLLSSPAWTKCHTYVVEKGDTLYKISKKILNTPHQWYDIKLQNNLKSKKLQIGQELTIYEPTSLDWMEACEDILRQRWEQLDLQRSTSKYYELIDGIAAASNILEVEDPDRLLEICRWAITTAEQESMYEFAIGSAGEVGMYQFKLDTVRLTLRWYDLQWNQSDKSLVSYLITTSNATMIFVLHYYELWRREKKDLWLAWRRYNNGSEAAAYASKALDRYRRIKRLQPKLCN